MFEKLKQKLNKPIGQSVETPQSTETEGPDSLEGYEIFDPGSSFNQQTSFIQRERPKTEVVTSAPSPDTPMIVINPEEVARAAVSDVVIEQPENVVAEQNNGGIDPEEQQKFLEQQQRQMQIQQEQQQSNIGVLDQSALYNSPTLADDPNNNPNAPTGLPENIDEYGNPAAGPIQKIRKPKKRYRYTIINSIGKKENGTFDAEEENDVRNFLLSQDYQVLSVKERSKWDVDIGSCSKMSPSDLSFSLTQLSTYIKSGISLSDAVKILAKQTKKAGLKKSFNQLVYELLKGESFSEAMEMQSSIYPKLLVNMVKTSEMTGDLPTILDDMAEYYTSMDQTRKQMKSAMTYPIVVLTIAFGVLVFMLTYLVPQFTQMFEDQGAELPALTRAIVNISAFMREKWYLIVVTVLIIGFAFYYAFTRIQKFREFVQITLMHTPVLSNIIIYNEIANFTKTFASLINHGVFITDSMEILSKITSNEVYKRIINKTLENLAKGETISTAFRGEWAIPIVAYEMIVTGESTGQLGTMMEKVADHFQMLHKTVIDQMKSLVEPIMICFLAVIVGIILVSIIQPMFSIYSQIK
jgi:type IV pilus assembly protein PilC